MHLILGGARLPKNIHHRQKKVQAFSGVVEIRQLKN